MNGGERPQHLQVGDLRIGYRRAGSGEPLVLLHGGPGNGREWRSQLDGLSDEFDVVAWDMPGTGASDDPPPTWGPREYADCLAEFLAALELAHPHVVGLSFGSGLALELYRWHPALPRSLILAAAYAGWSGSLPADVVAGRKARMREMTQLTPDAWAREWLPTLVTPEASPDVVAELTSILMEFHPLAQRTLVESGWAEQDAREVLRTITVPTLLIYGDRDARSPRPVAEDLHAAIRGSSLVFIEAAGHMVSMESPRRFNDEVRAFLRQVDADTRPASLPSPASIPERRGPREP